MRRFLPDEASDLIWVCWGQSPESAQNGLTEAFIPDCSVADAIQDIETFLATLGAEISPDSYEVHPDTSAISDLPIARVVFKTECV